jgi:hypothetical protein
VFVVDGYSFDGGCHCNGYSFDGGRHRNDPAMAGRTLAEAAMSALRPSPWFRLWRDDSSVSAQRSHLWRACNILNSLSGIRPL